MNEIGKVKVSKEMKAKRKEQKLEQFIATLNDTEQLEKTTNGKNQTVSGRSFTVSIALPCSILDNCQSTELKCYVVSQIARAAAIFGINEIVVYNDSNSPLPQTSTGEYAIIGRQTHSALLMAKILQYLECPPFLRRFLFSPSKELEIGTLINPLNIPHHFRDCQQYREGIVTNRTPKPGKGSFINIGESREVQVDRLLEEGVRVTVRIEDSDRKKCVKGHIISPRTPQQEKGIYWGYSVRIAKNFAEIFKDNPFGEKYDLTIGTSDKGDNIHSIALPSFQHLLIVFGGLKGIECALENDEGMVASNPSELFNYYLNTCPDQGSRTIRTEEALLITLAALQCHFQF